MLPQSVIIHERLANWARQLRPRFPGWPIRWSETRSTPALVRAAWRVPCPILILDLGDRPARGLEDLGAVLEAAPTSLSLVLDPHDHPEVAPMAKELGATIVLRGPAVPPEVARLLDRWLPLARHRAESGGWFAGLDPEPEPWDET